MKNGRNKTLKVVDDFKVRFHKFLKNDIPVFNVCFSPLKRVSIFLNYVKKNDNNIFCIDGFSDHNHTKVSE